MRREGREGKGGAEAGSGWLGAPERIIDLLADDDGDGFGGLHAVRLQG